MLGRSLLERDRFDDAEQSLRAADATFEQLSSISHRAGAWVALGDLAARRGEDVGGSSAVPECRRGPSGPAVLERKEEANEDSPAVLRAVGVSASSPRGVRPLAASSAGRTAARAPGLARLAACASPRSLVLAACFIAAGCGGSSSAQEEPGASTPETTQRSRTPNARGALARAGRGRRDRARHRRLRAGLGPASPSSSSTARAASSPGRRRKVWLAKELKAKPFAETTADVRVDRRRTGTSRASRRTSSSRTSTLDKPGTYWVLAEPVGGRKIQAVGNVVVKTETAAPDVGAAASRRTRRRSRTRPSRS